MAAQRVSSAEKQTGIDTGLILGTDPAEFHASTAGVAARGLIADDCFIKIPSPHSVAKDSPASGSRLGR
jgi:hypothetical protein